MVAFQHQPGRVQENLSSVPNSSLSSPASASLNLPPRVHCALGKPMRTRPLQVTGSSLPSNSHRYVAAKKRSLPNASLKSAISPSPATKLCAHDTKPIPKHIPGHVPAQPSWLGLVCTEG